MGIQLISVTQSVITQTVSFTRENNPLFAYGKSTGIIDYLEKSQEVIVYDLLQYCMQNASPIKLNNSVASTRSSIQIRIGGINGTGSASCNLEGALP